VSWRATLNADGENGWTAVLALAISVVVVIWGTTAFWLARSGRVPFRGLWLRFGIASWLLAAVKITVAVGASELWRNSFRAAFIAVACEALWSLVRRLPALRHFPTPIEAGGACRDARLLVEEIVDARNERDAMTDDDRRSAERTIHTLVDIESRLNEKR